MMMSKKQWIQTWHCLSLGFLVFDSVTGLSLGVRVKSKGKQNQSDSEEEENIQIASCLLNK